MTSCVSFNSFTWNGDHTQRRQSSQRVFGITTCPRATASATIDSEHVVRQQLSPKFGFKSRRQFDHHELSGFGRPAEQQHSTGLLSHGRSPAAKRHPHFGNAWRRRWRRKWTCWAIGLIDLATTPAAEPATGSAARTKWLWTAKQSTSAELRVPAHRPRNVDRIEHADLYTVHAATGHEDTPRKLL